MDRTSAQPQVKILILLRSNSLKFQPLVSLVCRGTGARICKRLRSPRIDSEKSIPPAYVAWRAGTTNMVVVPARQAGNRFVRS
jgi:hypothetical protein